LFGGIEKTLKPPACAVVARPEHRGGFQLIAIFARCIKARQRLLARRLDRINLPEKMGLPVLRARNDRFDLVVPDLGTPYGGIARVRRLTQSLCLADELEARLSLLKLHLCNHMPSLAYNARPADAWLGTRCGGGCGNFDWRNLRGLGKV
jgi:hypothetical protein